MKWNETVVVDTEHEEKSNSWIKHDCDVIDDCIHSEVKKIKALSTLSLEGKKLNILLNRLLFLNVGNNHQMENRNSNNVTEWYIDIYM